MKIEVKLYSADHMAICHSTMLAKSKIIKLSDWEEQAVRFACHFHDVLRACLDVSNVQHRCQVCISHIRHHMDVMGLEWGMVKTLFWDLLETILVVH